ncbi:tetrapyrrole biosynthesis, uroporphyrinogen III synthase [Gautieria morchelliformis]|nr:tetrapyrrole biosynthesis, uroporphyrinogen III synthase [Gautieria morchelliformis]
MSRAVILFKSQPRIPTADAYVQQLEAAGYTPYFIEVLESTFSNEQMLEGIVRTGPTCGVGFAGVVLTSSRAADAWIAALSRITEPGDWSQTPFYVVGESTKRTLKQMTTMHSTRFSESLILGAAQAGSSEPLARFVLDDRALRRTGGKLLYLTGDKNKDTFHRIMSENGVIVEEIMVYETKAANGLEERVASTAQQIANVEGGNKLTWLIFFAPSSSDFVLHFLRRSFRFSHANSPQDAELTAKLGAIGATTATFLREERGLRVDAVPAKPTAEQLVASICESDRNGA